MKLLNGVAKKLYLLLNRKRLGVSKSVRVDLETLYPGQDLEGLCEDYGVAKLEKSLLILVVGSVLAVCLGVRAAGERRITDNQIPREDVLGAERGIILETKLKGEDTYFEVTLYPTRMTEEEAQACFQEFCEKLPDFIRGKNLSLQEVTGDLELLDTYEGYPFLVEWKSNWSDVIDSSGHVVQGEDNCAVELEAHVSYGTLEWEIPMTVRVPAEILTEEQAGRRTLERELVITQEATATEPYWLLPESLDGEALDWHIRVEDYSLLLGIGAVAVAGAIYFLKDKDLHQENEKRKERMKGEYPDVVHKLALYLGAGMTLQGAFGRIASEYEVRKAKGCETAPAYDEIVYTCLQIKAGVSETVAYENFGKRTGVQEYIRLSTLLVQNLRKGSTSLVPRLREEAECALAQRLMAGRKLGEEASTKLLLPMIMMLAVVMVMVMLPAFYSMGM